jgi:hypothetical protein
VGRRYRREVSDLGLGIGRHEMRQRLADWGYAASRESCQEWLRTHRQNRQDVRFGGASVWQEHSEQLKRWYHVDKMGPTELQDMYRSELGIYVYTMRHRQVIGLHGSRSHSLTSLHCEWRFQTGCLGSVDSYSGAHDSPLRLEELSGSSDGSTITSLCLIALFRSRPLCRLFMLTETILPNGSKPQHRLFLH